MELFEISEKALDRVEKKEKFFRDLQACLNQNICPKCGEDVNEKAWLESVCNNPACGIIWVKNSSGFWVNSFTKEEYEKIYK